MTSRFKTTVFSCRLGVVALTCALAGAACGSTPFKIYEPSVSAGLGISSSNLAKQFKDTFNEDFESFNPTFTSEDLTYLYQVAVDAGLFRHEDHNGLDFLVGGGFDLSGLQRMNGQASSASVTVARLGESRINHFYLRSGPSFDVTNNLRLWPFYQKGLTQSTGTWGDLAVARATGQRIGGTTVETAERRRQHAAAGIRAFVKFRDRLRAYVEAYYSNDRFVHPDNPAEGGNHARSWGLAGGVSAPLWFLPGATR